ncbi:hypothetical protein ACFYO2_03240 [Streptomyces sp. NPDC006602]|uniref:hypothetical protein n=1 Tax=Streptomyces sp. NPDC006602 TaxID=3364751 RepID=UPI0036C63ED6
MRAVPRQVLIATATLGVLAVTSACGGPDDRQAAAADSVEVPPTPEGRLTGASGSASPSASASVSPSASHHGSASDPASTSASVGAAKETSGSDSAAGSGSGGADAAPAAPDFPVPVEVGDATQLITVKASGS